MTPRFSMQAAVSHGAFGTSKGTHVLSKPKWTSFSAGAVVAVQIGNHEDWPAIFIACLRKQLVVLPLDQSIGEQQRDAALEICKASAVVSASPAKILRRSFG